VPGYLGGPPPGVWLEVDSSGDDADSNRPSSSDPSAREASALPAVMTQLTAAPDASTPEGRMRAALALHAGGHLTHTDSYTRQAAAAVLMELAAQSQTDD